MVEKALKCEPYTVCSRISNYSSQCNGQMIKVKGPSLDVYHSMLFEILLFMVKQGVLFNAFSDIAMSSTTHSPLYLYNMTIMGDMIDQ